MDKLGVILFAPKAKNLFVIPAQAENPVVIPAKLVPAQAGSGESSCHSRAGGNPEKIS